MLAANTRGAAEHSTRAASAAAPLRSKSSVSDHELFALNTSAGTAALLSLEPAGAEQHTAGRASAARIMPRQRGRKPASSAAAAAAARTGGSRSPSPQPPQRQPLAAPRSGFAAATVLDVVGGICIALLAAEAAAGRWLALPQPADIPAAVGSAAGAGGSAAGQQAGGTRILFGSCNKLSCDAGRREQQQQHAQQQTRGGMSVRLEEALLPQDIADSPYPSGQGCVHPAAAAAIWPAILQRAEGADAWLWCEQCLFRPIYTLKRVFYQDGLGTNIGNVDGNKRSVLRRAGDAVYADVRVSLVDGLRLSSDENNSFSQLFREGTKPNPFIGASPRRLSGLLELLKSYPVSENGVFE